MSRRARTTTVLGDADLARREPVWNALSTLWLDRESTPRDLAWIAGVLHASRFSLAELRAIYLYEVAPSVHGHRRVEDGKRDAFDEPWLYGRAKRRAEHRSVWLRLCAASGFGRARMTSATEPCWNIVVDLLERMRARAASAPACAELSRPVRDASGS